MEPHVLIFGLFLLGLHKAVSSTVLKSSLTFVIDDTGSMQIDIHEVNKTVKSIFESVKSEGSHIDDFVVVTFNDPEVKLRNNAHSRSDFENALSNIEPRGGGDCAEKSMSGMQLGLENSRPGSLLWVFTDASAADMDHYYKVEELSQKMGSQVYIAITGLCDNRTDPDFLVYRDLAIATNGQVFHLRKSHIGKLFKYLELLIEDRKDIVTSRTFVAGGRNKIEVNVDDYMDQLIIAVSGENPVVTLTNSGGVLVTEDIVRLGEIAVVRAAVVDPGEYKVEVISKSETHVVISASTELYFEHGFSIFAPTNIKGTTRKPVPGKQSHLSIQLASEEEGLELRTVQILDMEDNILLEKPLKLVNTQLYTTEKITPPNNMFKVAIKFYDTSNKTYLTRHGLTPIKPQNRTAGDATPKSPIVTIEGGPNINAAYYHPLQLRCKIKGYPAPSVIWTSSDTSANLTFDKTVSIFELPNDYISVLDIPEVKNNATYTCTAINAEGTKEDTVSVQTQVIIDFTDIESPDNSTIEYLKPGRIGCKVEAFPAAKVSWYKNGKPLKPDGNLEVSNDGSVLTIRAMELYMADNYNCSVENALVKKTFPFKLAISGLIPPTINRVNQSIILMTNSKIDLKCMVTAGIPKPDIIWLYKDVDASEFARLNTTVDTIHFDSVNASHAGIYKCLAYNIAGSDSLVIRLNVKDKCKMPKDAGPCTAAFERYYYDSNRNECSQFIYGGCWGNENRFKNKNDCLMECVTAKEPVIPQTTLAPMTDKCKMPKDAGPCTAAFERYYFDSNRNECSQFIYGGCWGNENRFKNKNDCLMECVTKKEPVIPQTTLAPMTDKCKMPKDAGPCTAAFERYYYDSNRNECSQFVYGGCWGNENRFKNKNDCLMECVTKKEPVIPQTTLAPMTDKCKMPKDAGPCTAAFERYYYDSNRNECSQFIYGGCWGNENRFKNKNDCLMECVTTKEPVIPQTTLAPMTDKCKMPKDAGPCTAAFERYYFDSNRNECSQFIYGGCWGNENRFKNKNDCLMECVTKKEPVIPQTTLAPMTDKCKMPKDAGPCTAAFERYYYDSNRNECSQFVYGGCWGNENRFKNKNDCLMECVTKKEPVIPQTTLAPMTDKCKMPKDAGPCTAAFERYYYDSNRNECSQFIYGGCWGNENRFKNKNDCLMECVTKKEPVIPQTTLAPMTDKCNMPKDAGPCNAAFEKYYYDSNSNECREFIYGGCHGNENRFDSEEDCRAACDPTASDQVTPPKPIGCYLDVKQDLNGNDPLMLTNNDEFTNFESNEGYLLIPANETIKLFCPGKFKNFMYKEIIVTCDSEKQFLHQPLGRRYVYADLKCNEQWQYKNVKTGRQCSNIDSELLKVGFETGTFQEVYQVCLNRMTNNPIFTKQNLIQSLPNAVSNTDTVWFDNEASVDLDNAYNCNSQNRDISKILNKEFHKDGCCFAKRILVNPLDVEAGLPQATTYSYLNVAPHWSICNSQNWENIEQRIRDLRRKSGRPLLVWTGVTQHLQMLDASNNLKNITFSQSGKEFQVPKYFWKVVQDSGSKASLAIIQVNVPDLKLKDVRKHILCTDVCRTTKWMSSADWRNPARGLTYCCRLEEFKSSFQLGFYKMLPTSKEILSDVTNLPNNVV